MVDNGGDSRSNAGMLDKQPVIVKSTAQYRRMRAEEARTIAEEMHDPVTRRMMQGIVAGYEQPAERTKKLEQDKGLDQNSR